MIIKKRIIFFSENARSAAAHFHKLLTKQKVMSLPSDPEVYSLETVPLKKLWICIDCKPPFVGLKKGPYRRDPNRASLLVRLTEASVAHLKFYINWHICFTPTGFPLTLGPQTQLLMVVATTTLAIVVFVTAT